MSNSEGEPRFRPMDAGDFDAMIALWRRCDGVGLRAADSPAGIGRYLERNPGLSLVALLDGRLVGTVMAGHDGKRGYLQHLAVDPACRGRGIGSALVARCIAGLGAIGILKTHIHVLARNAGGRRFWLNRGWQPRDDLVTLSFINSDNPDV